MPSDIPYLVKGPSFAEGLPDEPEIAQFRSAIDDAGALDFFEYWLAKCGAGTIPAKAQIDPIDIPKLLSAMFIEEWDAETEQSRIRLAGEFHREPDGTNIQDRTVDELADGETAKLWKACDRCNFFELRPTICAYDLDHFDKPFVRHADLALPVRDSDSAILVYGYSWLL